MPYTLAHPGFILPLKKRLGFLSLQGMVWGSIAPDLDLLFRLSNSRDHVITFDLMNILFIILPITMIISIFYSLLAKQTYVALVSASPLPLARWRWDRDQVNSMVRNIPIEALSILAGIGLHLLLDHISHWNAAIWSYMFYFLTGSGNFAVYSIYYTAWYLPQILLTFAGAYLAYRYISPYGKHDSLTRSAKKSIVKNMPFYITFLLSGCAFFAVRLAFAGLQWSFGLHYLVIYSTGALIFAVLAAPVLYAIWLEISKFTR